MWDFIQNELLGMRWLHTLTGTILQSCRIDTGTRMGGSIHFFLYDTIKIMILLGFLIFVISLIQSYFPPERTKNIVSRFHGPAANTAII